MDVDSDVDANNASELMSESLFESLVVLYSVRSSVFFFSSSSLCLSLFLFPLCSHTFSLHSVMALLGEIT